MLVPVPDIKVFLAPGATDMCKAITGPPVSTVGRQLELLTTIEFSVDLPPFPIFPLI